MLYMIQFSSDGKRIRLIKECLVDAYAVGDRLMEGVEFVVSVKNGKLSVKASEDATDYIKSFEGSVKKWEKRVFEYVKDGLDNGFLHETDDGWECSEIHTNDSLDCYLVDQGLVLEK